MKQTIEAILLPSGTIQPRHEVEVVCKACGYDLTPEELEALIESDIQNIYLLDLANHQYNKLNYHR
jgi:hypothetical protein